MIKYANQKEMEQYLKMLKETHRIVFPGKLSFKNEDKIENVRDRKKYCTQIKTEGIPQQHTCTKDIFLKKCFHTLIKNQRLSD